MVIRLVVGFLLARYISPEEFGALALVSLTVTLSWNLIDPGLKTRVLQDHEHGSDLLPQFHHIASTTGRWISILLINIGLFGFLFEWWNPIYSLYIEFFAISTLFSGFGVMRYADLYRRKEISYLAKTDFWVQIPLSVASIIVAYWGFPIPALVLFFIIPLWLHHSIIISKVSIPKPDSVSSVFEIFKKNGGLFTHQITDQALRKVDSLILGWISGPFWLGVYNRGYGLSVQATHLVQGVFQPILLPEKKNYHHLVAEITSIVTAIILFIIAFGADWWIPLAWGEDWSALIPFMPLFSWLALSHLQIKLIDLQLLRDLKNSVLGYSYLLALIFMILLSLISLTFFGIEIFFMAISIYFSMFAVALSLKSELLLKTKCVFWCSQAILGWFGVTSVWHYF